VALLKAKDGENKAVVVDVVARKKKTQLEKARDTFARVIVGSQSINNGSLAILF